MKDELKRVYLELLNIEVKGRSAIIMANCLITLEKLISESTEPDSGQ